MSGKIVASVTAGVAIFVVATWLLLPSRTPGETAYEQRNVGAGAQDTISSTIYGERPGQALLHVYEGVEFYFFWPRDPVAPHLSADEAEFILVNTNKTAVTISDPLVAFTDGPQTVSVYSGTWEKFPSRSSWERTEYVNIGQDQYQGTLTLAPGEKGKLHYHLKATPTNVRVRATLTVAEKKFAIDESISRPANRSPTEAKADQKNPAKNH